MLDTTLSMDDQVKAVCRTAYAQLRDIGHIRRYLTTDAAKKVVNSLVTTRLDYFSSLLYGIPGRLLARLQKVQNTAARIVSRTSRYAHITPVLQELHWLPIESRLKYKVLLMAHRALHGSAPQYLADMLTIYQPGRSLRSQSTTRLVVCLFCLFEFNVSLSQQRTYRDHASPRNESLYCPDQDSILVSQDTMIDEQSQRVDTTTP